MTIAYLGGLTVGGAAPGAEVAVSAGISGSNQGLDPISVQLGSLTAYVPVPISFTAQLAEAQKLLDGLNAAITLGLAPPSIEVQQAALDVAIGQLQGIVGGISAQLDILAALQGPLAAAGVHGYAFDGAVSALGGELGAQLAGGVPGGSPSDHANAVVFITTVPGTWAAMGEIFKVTP